MMHHPFQFARRCRLLLIGLTLSLIGADWARAAGSTREAIDNVLPKMVKIFGAGGVKNLAAYGTGFLVSPEGHVVTVWSHVLDSDETSVVLHNGRRYTAKVLGAEPQLDLAVLKLEGDNLGLPFFDLDEATNVGPGTRVLGFSNMFKVAVGDEAVSVLHGVVAAFTKLQTRRGTFEMPYDGNVYVVDAITNNSGAGGGVLTTRDGFLLAMIGKEVRNAETNTWLNYAVPVTELRQTIRDIISGNFTSRDQQKTDENNPRRYYPRDLGLVMLPDVLFRTPAYIGSILPDSPAAGLDLQSDDLVLFINDQLVQSIRQLNGEVGRLEFGDTVKLVVRRGNKLVTVELTVPKKLEQP